MSTLVDRTHGEHPLMLAAAFKGRTVRRQQEIDQSVFSLHYLPDATGEIRRVFPRW